MSKEKRLDCPYCGKEGHLYLNLDKGVFYCFRCGARGRSSALESQGIRVEKQSLNTLYQPGTISHRVSEAMSDPPDYKHLSISCINYLTGRGVHDTILRTLRNKIYETDNGLLFFYPDEDYWQERRWKELGGPRWVNPSQAPRTPATGVVYHVRTHYDEDRIVLVEGIMDALRVAPFGNAAALLSSNFHERQLFGLSLAYDNADILLDSDVGAGKLLSTLQRAQAIFKSARLLHCTASDPGEMEDEDIIETLA